VPHEEVAGRAEDAAAQAELLASFAGLNGQERAS
jgi:hypothetical protein